MELQLPSCQPVTALAGPDGSQESYVTGKTSLSILAYVYFQPEGGVGDDTMVKMQSSLVLKLRK